MVRLSYRVDRDFAYLMGQFFSYRYWENIVFLCFLCALKSQTKESPAMVLFILRLFDTSMQYSLLFPLKKLLKTKHFHSTQAREKITSPSRVTPLGQSRSRFLDCDTSFDSLGEKREWEILLSRVRMGCLVPSVTFTYQFVGRLVYMGIACVAGT